MFQSPISYCDPVYRVLLVYAFTRNFGDYQVMLALALRVLVSVQVKIREQSLVPGSRRPTRILNKTFGTTLRYKMAITNYQFMG